MWAGLRVEISCFSITSTDALNMVGPAGQPVMVTCLKWVPIRSGYWAFGISNDIGLSLDDPF